MKVPAEEVNLGGAAVRLRALSLPEVSRVFRDHAATLAREWGAFGPLIRDFQEATGRAAAMWSGTKR